MLFRSQGLRANQNDPWFHLNSCLAGTRFIPGNGGDRRSISAPRLQGAFSPPPQGLAPTVLSLVRGSRDTLPCHSLSNRMHSITFLKSCQVRGRFGSFFLPKPRRFCTNSQKLWRTGPMFAPFQRKTATNQKTGPKDFHLGPVFVDGFTFSPGRRPRSHGGWAPCRWSRWSHPARPAARCGSHGAHRRSWAPGSRCGDSG